MMEEFELRVPSAKVQVEKYLHLIRNDAWITEKSNWIFIGQCIHNVFGVDGKELFERYTISEHRDQLDEIWHSYEQTRHGVAALKHLARKINLQELKEWLLECTLQAAYGACDNTSGMTEIADICKFMFGDQFVCASVTNNRWFQFINAHWQALDGGHTMKQKFSRQLVRQFHTVKGGLEMHIDWEDKDDPNLKRWKRCITIIKGLKEPSFKANLMKECSEIFYVEEFEKNCDEEPHILGLPNGVYDFRLNMFRNAFPEDYLTLQMGAHYRDHYSWEHPEVREVMSFFKKVLCAEDLVEFVLLHKATCLVGGNLDKYLASYIGETAHNGKTTCEKLDELTFGKYCGKLPLGVLVGKTPEAGAANPAKAGTKGKRLLYIDEANKKQNMNASEVKSMTGNDTFWARPLYSNGFEIKPQFTLIMIVNRAPRNDSPGDNGIRERMVMIPFESRFVSKPPETEAEQWQKRIFKADPFIEDRLRGLKDAYLWVLIQYYYRYLQKGLKKPQAVIDKTDKYQYANDVFLQFKTAKIMEGSPHEYVQLNTLYTHFKTFFNQTQPGSKPVDYASFKEEITRVLPSDRKEEDRWFGFKMKVEATTWNRTAE